MFGSRFLRIAALAAAALASPVAALADNEPSPSPGRQPLPPTGNPAPWTVEFTGAQIGTWTDHLAAHVKPRAFFEQLQSDDIQQGAVYVQFRPGTDLGEMLVANLQAGVRDVRWQSQIIPGLMQVVVEPGRELAAIQSFLAVESVVYAEPDYLLTPAETIPDDPLLNALWGMENIRAPEAWDFHTGNQNHRIAVIDSGILLTHEDLVDNLVPGLGWNFFDGNNSPNDVDGNENPCNFHGTHVAGTAAARGNNAVGVVGVNWRATIVPIKICGPVLIDGLWKCRCPESVPGLEYALNNGTRVSNHSYGGTRYSQSMFMILAARNSNHIVAAAMNTGSNNDTTPFYPASYGLNNIIAVANITESNLLANNSNFGPNSVHLGAPGSVIRSTDGPGSSYGNKSGTSMASPHVAGAIALLQSANSTNIPYTWIRDRVFHAVQPTLGLQGTTTTGGRLDLREAMNVYGQPVGTTGGTGSKFNPFNSFDACLNWTPSGFQLHLYPSTTNWTGVIDQPIEIRSSGGSAIIGAQ